jgi:hypothetical protein
MPQAVLSMGGPLISAALAVAAKLVPNGVICHDSALAFYELTDRIPPFVWVAIGPREWRPNTRVRFHLGEFFASGAGASFLTVAPFRFRIEAVDEHFHLPMKFTRWGYSLFRGA